jgi:hypothetical protein
VAAEEEEEKGTGSPVEPSLAFASASRGQARDLPYGSQLTVQMRPIGTAADPSLEFSAENPAGELPYTVPTGRSRLHPIGNSPHRSHV